MLETVALPGSFKTGLAGDATVTFTRGHFNGKGQHTSGVSDGDDACFCTGEGCIQSWDDKRPPTHRSKLGAERDQSSSRISPCDLPTVVRNDWRLSRRHRSVALALIMLTVAELRLITSLQANIPVCHCEH
ncbi:MAG: hypothetical protein ACKPKO_48725, partial [Candidatus Fonsibacter sp.]